MRNGRFRTLFFGLAVVAFLPAHAADAMEAGLAVGEPAPAFSLPGTDGKTHSLDDHRGERAVVIAFFPKAFTSG